MVLLEINQDIIEKLHFNRLLAYEYNDLIKKT